MATVNYSVPDKVKEAFNATFAGRNKSAIIAELMLKGIQEEKDRIKRNKAIDRMLASRKTRRPVKNEDIEKIRKDLRK